MPDSRLIKFASKNSMMLGRGRHSHAHPYTKRWRLWKPKLVIILVLNIKNMCLDYLKLKPKPFPKKSHKYALEARYNRIILL
jgi:hypothetical protein